MPSNALLRGFFRSRLHPTMSLYINPNPRFANAKTMKTASGVYAPLIFRLRSVVAAANGTVMASRSVDCDWRGGHGGLLSDGYFRQQTAGYWRFPSESEEDSDRDGESSSVASSDKVSIPINLQREVDALLGDYLARKRNPNPNFPFSRSSSTDSLGTDKGFLEQQDPQTSTSIVMEKIVWRRSLQLRNQQHSWQESPGGQEMLEFCRSLPSYKEKYALLAAISQNQVLLQIGETGCGKTTQLPQYILESEIDAARGAGCSIICTQPRRISAMAVSEE